MSEHRTTEDIKYPFTREEIYELGQRLAQAYRKLDDLEREKKTGLTSFSSLIKEQQKVVADLSIRVETGYEMRPAEVLVLYHDPRPGYKKLIVAASGEYIREEKMTPEELQEQFDFNIGDGPPGP
jgi:hypothetical protein